MRKNSSWVDVSVDEILAETDNAFLCAIGDDEIWLPKSQIADSECYEEGDADVVVSIPAWLAREKGLEDVF